MFEERNSFTELATQESKEKLYTEAAVAYNKGEPIISDSEFDLLEQELIKAGSALVNKTHDEIAGAAIDSDTFSIRPVHSRDDIISWINRQPVGEFMCSLKLDGVLAKVQTGYNFSAESRGRNENIPWDYTAALRTVLPEQTNSYFIRGECFIPNEHLEHFRNTYNPEIYKVARSAAITVLRRPQDHVAEDIRKLKFIAYFIEGKYATKKDMFEHLESIGFETPYHKVVKFTDVETDFDVLQADMEQTADPADGVVIEYNDLSVVPASSDNKYQSSQIAAKIGKWGLNTFTTVVRGVKLTPGKGHYGTVLVCEPVRMPDGITQQNINVFNVGVIIRNKIGIGSVIKFTRQSNGMCYYEN